MDQDTESGSTDSQEQATPARCDPADGALTGEINGVPDELELAETEASRTGINYAVPGVQVTITFRVTGDTVVEPDS